MAVRFMFFQCGRVFAHSQGPIRSLAMRTTGCEVDRLWGLGKGVWGCRWLAGWVTLEWDLLDGIARTTASSAGCRRWPAVACGHLSCSTDTCRRLPH